MNKNIYMYNFGILALHYGYLHNQVRRYMADILPNLHLIINKFESLTHVLEILNISHFIFKYDNSKQRVFLLIF